MTPFPLTAQHLVYTCEAVDTLRFVPHKMGVALRGAFAQVLLRVACPTHGDCPQHNLCPACDILRGNEGAGNERRAYALRIAHAPTDGIIPASHRFTFGLTLFGSGMRQLPYWITPWASVGEIGVGAQRGRFTLCRIDSINPFDGSAEVLLAEGDKVVRTPSGLISHSNMLVSPVDPTTQHVHFDLIFVTPMRLMMDRIAVQSPQFGLLFKQTLKRLDDLTRQFSDPAHRRPREEIDALEAAANRVALIGTDTRWVNLYSHSSRTRDVTSVGGFVGRASYVTNSKDWHDVAPWLRWGELAQVGKNVVKGEGVFEIAT
jgi:hypothetical protein